MEIDVEDDESGGVNGKPYGWTNTNACVERQNRRHGGEQTKDDDLVRPCRTGNRQFSGQV